MRFSLKWLLAGTVYVAIAAAAFAKPHWMYSDALVALSFLALTYALITAVFARGRRQVVAGGFAIACALLAIGIQAPPSSLPTTRYIVLNTSVAAIDADPRAAVLGANATANLVVDEHAKRRRAARAISTLAAGLVGAMLGAVAYRRERGEREGE